MINTEPILRIHLVGMEKQNMRLEYLNLMPKLELQTLDLLQPSKVVFGLINESAGSNKEYKVNKKWIKIARAFRLYLELILYDKSKRFDNL
jgi:hypothetical protein